MPLTAKQARFCQEYLLDLNATQAAIRAGYAPTDADVQGPRLLNHVEVRAEIERLQAERAEKLGIDAAYVLRQAVKLHERCMQEVYPLTDRKGEPVTDEEGRRVYAFDAKGAVSSLNLIGKHVNVQAFQDNLNIGGLDALAERLSRATREEDHPSAEEDQEEASPAPEWARGLPPPPPRPRG